MRGSTVPAHKNVLLRLDVRRAGKLCYCRHDKKHAITKGELRFVVREPGPAQRDYGYCAKCALEMLDQAEDELAELRSELE